MHRPGYRDTLLPPNLPFWRFSPKVRYPNRNFVAKNWTSQRGARGVVHGKSIFYYFSIGMYRKTLKNGVFGLKYDLDHPKSIFYRKQSTLCTYRNLFNHISGHFIFWPTIPGRRRGHFRGWFRQKTAFLGECETWMTLNRFSNTNKWLCELVRAYYNTFQDITVFDPSHRGVAGAISGADFAKNSIFKRIWDFNDPKSVFKHKQMNLRTSGSLLQHISGHYSFWPITRGRRRAHFRGWFRQKQHFWVNLRLEWPEIGFQTQTNDFVN